jgi:hypothetical protein
VRHLVSRHVAKSRASFELDALAVSHMNRRVVRGLAVLGCVVAVSATTVIVEVNTGDGKDSGAALVASGQGLPSSAVLKYWVDSKNALSPLLLYVRQLPEQIKGIQHDNGKASDSALRQAANMAESFATARDLVGRIAVPADAPAGVGELLQVACQMYRQSSLALTELKDVEGAPARLAVTARAASLQAVGDRLFDQVRRVLAIDAVGEGQAPVDYRYVPPVPSVADLTGRPAAAVTTSDLDKTLSSARELISNASTGKGDIAPAGTRDELSTIAAALENAAAGQTEDVIGARLAISLALLATSADAAGQSASVDSLLMLSNDVWNQSRTLVPRPHEAMTALGAPKRTRAQVWKGGEFNGRPPALQPGQDVGSGLRGGLPKIDPTQILKG